MLNISVTGILVGGHVFVYDVCKNDLWLVKGRPEFNQLHPTENLQTEEIESFVNPSHFIIDVFGNQTIIIVIRRTAYIWQHSTHLQPEKQ